MKAEIIAVGSELLTPDRQDTNSLFLTAELNKIGIEIVRKTIVGDERALMMEAFRDALNRVPIIISSGGLGPNEDDLTRETVAELLGRRLARNDDVVRSIEARFRSFGRPMTENNLRQAMVPEGAELLANPRGTAPGLWLEKGDQVIALLPGPPRELKPLFHEQVLPRLTRRAPAGRMFHRELRITGLGESHVDSLAGPIYTRYPEVQTTVLASPGEVQIHLRMWSADPDHALRMLADLQQALDIALAERIFSRDGSPLEAVVAHELLQHHATIAAAESCTGGLLAERLTNIAGSSAYFLGSVVCYSNELKSAWADVPAELIATKGAVSSEVAVALAQGIRGRAGSTLGVGITGIAGPGGGTEEKPVGTVHLAVAGPAGVHERAVRFIGDRDMVRMQASQAALDMVRLHFLYNGQAPPVRS